MTKPKHSRHKPQHRYWHEDFPERDAPDKTAPELDGDLNYLDDTYLEISRSSKKMSGVMIFFSIPLFLAVIFISAFIFRDIPSWIQQVGWIFLALPIAMLGAIAVGIHGIRLDVTTPRDQPIRFNRKLGKVYLYEYKHTWNPFGRWRPVTREFDWNTLQAEITRAAGFNGAGYMVRYALVLSSLKPGTNEVVDRFALKDNNVLTWDLYATWAYCKRYMAEGPAALPETPKRNQNISLRRSFFAYMPHLDPTVDGKLARQKTHWVEWFLALLYMPAYPILAVLGLCHYIATRSAPAAAWPSSMDLESSNAYGSRVLN